MVARIGLSCLTLSQQNPHSRLPQRKNFRKGSIRRPQILSCSASGNACGLRVFVLSDLHTDYSDNMRWVKSLSSTEYTKDLLLVAGDVAETYSNFVETMSLLRDRFMRVFFVPGNHDLWCRRPKQDQVNSVSFLPFFYLFSLIVFQQFGFVLCCYSLTLWIFGSCVRSLSLLCETELG